jgi:cell wall-associated NlpC family hydrolase
LRLGAKEPTLRAGDVVLPRNTHDQRLDPRILPIEREQILQGDLLFDNDGEHASMYLDAHAGGRMINGEPHGAQSAWRGMFGTGVRNYSSNSDDVSNIHHVAAINGPP